MSCVRAETKNASAINVIWAVQSSLKKYFVSRFTQITSIIPAVPPLRGAFRDRHGREAGCGGRGCAFDERRVTRTAKSCGPDASTLALS
jgi:hypothetical protein